MSEQVIPAQTPVEVPLTTTSEPMFLNLAGAWVRAWNWKAAALSALFRAPIFLATTYKYGWRSLSLAVAVEIAYRVGTSGVFAAFTQAIRDLQPVWCAALLISGAVPAVSLWLDYLLHLAMHTPNLAKGILVSLIVTAISSLFNWYSMCRETLLVGQGQRSFAADLCRMPALAFGFVLEPFLWIARWTRRWFASGRPHHGD